jgi:SulP family sulfate permease
MSDAVSIEQQEHEDLIEEVDHPDFILPPQTFVYAMEGPFFFGVAQRLESALEIVHVHAEILVLRLGKVPFIDATGMQTLSDLLDDCKRHKTRLVLCGTRPNVLKKMKRSGLLEQLGMENVLEHVQQISKAKEQSHE